MSNRADNPPNQRYPELTVAIMRSKHRTVTQLAKHLRMKQGTLSKVITMRVINAKRQAQVAKAIGASQGEVFQQETTNAQNGQIPQR